jgi:ABC-type Fe3+/spermidine/putrescine transport system ATPase subunit
MAAVELENIRLRYGNLEVLKGISLRLASSEFAAILGPSGCGKTSLLRIIGGFSGYTGSLRIDGRDVAGAPPYQRNIGIVFQDYALFPHKTVADNIGYGLRMRSVAKARIADRVAGLIELLKLKGLEQRYPAHLSGGQRQRVAIARALAIEPKMLLLDEPLSALDKKLREEMQVELRQIQKKVGITTLFVTHDQEEALALADTIVIMTDGAIRQIGTPSDIYLRPADEFVANFIGQSNLFDADVVENKGGVIAARLDGGQVVRIRSQKDASPGSRIRFCVRPERMSPGRSGTPANGSNEFEGRVDHATFLGAHWQLRITTKDSRNLKVQSPEGWTEGDIIRLSWRPEDAVILSA